MEDDKQKRSYFLKTTIGVIATAGLAVVSKKTLQNSGSKKIKMLTPDGKLVEVDESIVAKAGSNQQRASNKEVQEWMKTSKTK